MPEDVPALELIAALSDPKGQTMGNIIVQVGYSMNEAADIFVEALGHHLVKVRREAARIVLSLHQNKFWDMTKLLERAAQSEDETMKLSAERLLAKITSSPILEGDYSELIQAVIDARQETRSRPVVIGLAGASGAGKTFFVREVLGPSLRAKGIKVFILAEDDFQERPASSDRTIPRTVNSQRVRKALGKISAERYVDIPLRGARGNTDEEEVIGLKGIDAVIYEGAYAINNDPVMGNYIKYIDIALYIQETNLEDRKKRFYEKEAKKLKPRKGPEMDKLWERLKLDYAQNILPSKENADFIIHIDRLLRYSVEKVSSPLKKTELYFNAAKRRFSTFLFSPFIDPSDEDVAELDRLFASKKMSRGEWHFAGVIGMFQVDLPDLPVLVPLAIVKMAHMQPKDMKDPKIRKYVKSLISQIKGRNAKAAEILKALIGKPTSVQLPADLEDIRLAEYTLLVDDLEPYFNQLADDFPNGGKDRFLYFHFRQVKGRPGQIMQTTLKKVTFPKDIYKLSIEVKKKGSSASPMIYKSPGLGYRGKEPSGSSPLEQAASIVDYLDGRVRVKLNAGTSLDDQAIDDLLDDLAPALLASDHWWDVVKEVKINPYVCGSMATLFGWMVVGQYPDRAKVSILSCSKLPLRKKVRRHSMF